MGMNPDYENSRSASSQKNDSGGVILGNRDLRANFFRARASFSPPSKTAKLGHDDFPAIRESRR
jgi:hypothetical protein